MSDHEPPSNPPESGGRAAAIPNPPPTDPSGWNPITAGDILAEFETLLDSAKGEGSEILLGPAYRLFRQCVAAYKVKAVALTALGLRAVLENAGYWVLTHRREGTSSWRVIPLGEPSRTPLFRPTEWEERRGLEWILDQMEVRKILDTTLAQRSRLVTEHGHAIAHFAHRTDSTTYRELPKYHNAPWIAPAVEASAGKVLEDINATSRILIQLTKWDIQSGKEAQGRVNSMTPT